QAPGRGVPHWGTFPHWGLARSKLPARGPQRRQCTSPQRHPRLTHSVTSSLLSQTWVSCTGVPPLFRPPRRPVAPLPLNSTNVPATPHIAQPLLRSSCNFFEPDNPVSFLSRRPFQSIGFGLRETAPRGIEFLLIRRESAQSFPRYQGLGEQGIYACGCCKP